MARKKSSTATAVEKAPASTAASELVAESERARKEEQQCHACRELGKAVEAASKDFAAYMRPFLASYPKLAYSQVVQLDMGAAPYSRALKLARNRLNRHVEEVH